MDINAILNYTKPKESYYDILGCHQTSTIDQLNREYKIKALQLHPDKNSGPDAAEKFQQLQLAKEILTDEKRRKSYDSWLNSGIHIPFEQWESKKGHAMHWAPPRQMKPSIQASNSSGQDSNNLSHNRDLNAESFLLNKFRNYEI